MRSCPFSAYDYLRLPVLFSALAPNSDWTAELWPHGKRINMGAYGGRPQASMSPSKAGNIADLNHDNVVNYTDLMLFDEQWVRCKLLSPEDFDRNVIVDLADFAAQVRDWQTSGHEQPGDLNRDGIIDIADLALTAEEWLEETRWAGP